MADEGDEIALAAGFDTQNAEAVLGVVESDAVDQPCQELGRAAYSCCVRHDCIMAIIERGYHPIRQPEPSRASGHLKSRRRAKLAPNLLPRSSKRSGDRK